MDGGSNCTALNLHHTTPFGNKVEKQQKSKMKTLHNAAINNAIKSGDASLSAAGTELQSRAKIDSSTDNYQEVIKELCTMAQLVARSQQAQGWVWGEGWMWHRLLLYRAVHRSMDKAVGQGRAKAKSWNISSCRSRRYGTTSRHGQEVESNQSSTV